MNQPRNVSPQILKAIEAELDDDGMTPSAVHAFVGMWSLITIRHGLAELVRQGRARYEGADSRRLYFRVAT